jgi:hypothetical protein
MNSNKLKILASKNKFIISPNLKYIKNENYNNFNDDKFKSDIDLAIALSLSEKYNLNNDESSKLINQEIFYKSFDEESTSVNEFDHLLKSSIESLGGTCVVPNNGNGNCLYHTLSTHLNIDYQQLKLDAIQYISINWNKFKDFALRSDNLEPFKSKDEYIQFMSKNGSWGDHLTLLALCELYQINAIIIVINGNNFSDPIKINVGSTRTVLIKFNSEFHYEAII